MNFVVKHDRCHEILLYLQTFVCFVLVETVLGLGNNLKVSGRLHFVGFQFV